jgi:hypothetical protein
MDNTLFGIPLALWAMICLGIAAVYYYIWPRPHPRRATPRTTWRHVVLRYFHALVWVLLAAGCFAGMAGLSTLGLLLALAALPTYAIFLVTLLRDRQVELREVAAASAAAKAANTTAPKQP